MNLEAFAKLFQWKFWDSAHWKAWSHERVKRRELKATRSNIICWKYMYMYMYLMNMVITLGCCNLGSWHMWQLALKPPTAIELQCSAHIFVPGRVAPSAYAHGCAEHFREIISTKMSKTAFHEIFDPQNISTIRYTYQNFLSFPKKLLFKSGTLIHVYIHVHVWVPACGP